MCPVYYTYMQNKLVPAISNQFLSQIYKIKKCSSDASQQLALDLLELKTTLTNLPLISTDVNPALPRIPDSFTNLVTKSTKKVDERIKVISYPLESIKIGYETIVTDKSVEDFELILTLRGVKKAEMSGYTGK